MTYDSLSLWQRGQNNRKQALGKLLPAFDVFVSAVFGLWVGVLISGYRFSYEVVHEHQVLPSTLQLPLLLTGWVAGFAYVRSWKKLRLAVLAYPALALLVAVLSLLWKAIDDSSVPAVSLYRRLGAPWFLGFLIAGLYRTVKKAKSSLHGS